MTDTYTTRVYDALIVGGGMAGMLAAHAILRDRPHTSLLLADAGPALEERQRLATAVMGGSGGAGLYLGGRLYLGPSSIPVVPPTSMPDGFAPIISGDAYEQRAREVNTLLRDFGAQAPLRSAPDERIAEAITQAAAAGLDYVTSYPARFLTVEERRGVVRRLLRELERLGAHFEFGIQVTGVERSGEAFAIRLAHTHENEGGGKQRVRARALILAPGRYGLEWLVELLGTLGAAVVALPSAFGVRLELPAGAYAPLTDANPDPRLQRLLESDAVIKTYATCPGGVVVPVRRYGALVASGLPLPVAERRPSITVAILVQPGVRGAAEGWRGGEEIARALNERHPGRLIVQRMVDARRGQATAPETIASGPVQPTDPNAVVGRLDDVYPRAFWGSFGTFLRRVAYLAPGVESDAALVYGPAEERFWHFPTDEQLQTAVPGLFVAGDGPGQSQGIIQAGVAGLVAGAGVAAYLGA
jgi:uncharacterized FAD-dependent dehydrogenase